MKIKPEEYQALIDRIADLVTLPYLDPDTMVTVADLVEKFDISGHTARARLEKLVKQGKLERTEVRGPNGRKVIAYVEPK